MTNIYTKECDKDINKFRKYYEDMYMEILEKESFKVNFK